MGIVVCITMLLGLLKFSLSWRSNKQNGAITVRLDAITRYAPTLLLLMGLWNALWYGLRHLGSFWGNAALITGVVMVLAGLILLAEADTKNQYPALLQSVYQKLKPIRLLVFIALLMSFLLYAVTLIQLNLGYAIIH